MYLNRKSKLPLMKRNYCQKLKVILVLLFISCITNANSYYVSTSGNDSNHGKSPSNPWKSLEKINNTEFKPGDKIFFKRGDSWNGTLTLNISGHKNFPVVFGAYGTGENPRIYGSEKIIGWELHSGEIYKASVNHRVGQIFIDGERIRTARYPDDGYIYIDSVINETQFISQALNHNFDYTGSKWYGRTIYWHGVLRDVVASDSQKLSLNLAPERNLDPKEGFFLMNKLEFLTKPGEWYYDSETQMIYLWTPNGDSPSDYLVTASIYEDGIALYNSQYVIIENFDLREQDFNGINLQNNFFVTIKNNKISYADGYGIYAEGGENYVISDNQVSNSNGGGLNLKVKNSVISDNFIQNTAVFHEIGLKGTIASNGGSGAEISGDGNIIEYNSINNSNYNGLFYRGASVIRFNYIKNSCLFKDDGGAIYTNTSGSKGYIHNNIILNSIGNPEGYIADRGLAEGIYIDRIAQHVVVENNTIINTTDAGIKLHEIGNVKVVNNTIYGARYGIYCHRFTGEVSVVKDNNIFLTSDKDDYEPRQLFVRLGTYNIEFNRNRYITPFKSLQAFRAGKYLTFEQWSNEFGQDEKSEYIELCLNDKENHRMLYNASKSVKQYTLNGASGRNFNGELIPATFSLNPFTSIIIIGTNLDKIKEN
jgi:parallel beta-helix repeat protein